MLGLVKRGWFRALKWYASERYFPGYWLAQSARYFHDHYVYEATGHRRNGEAALLERLSGKLDLIFDVGANRGEWSKLAHEFHPKATIHAFEIVPSTFEKLAAAAPAGVVAHDFGLGDVDGEIELHVMRGNDEIASIFAMEHIDTIACIGHIRNGDEVCRELGVTHIDLLKIDVEGAEKRVLTGFQHLLAAGAIDVIQFEYGEFNIASRFLLADAYELLGPMYEIGLLGRRGVAFRPYLAEHESFKGPNYVAVRRARPDLIEALRA